MVLMEKHSMYLNDDSNKNNKEQQFMETIANLKD